MIFGNMSLSAFNPSKVTAWKTSLHADFQRQNLTYRGGIIAHAEAPTIRKIEADILVRGRDYNNLRLKLDGISRWLYETGASKLFAHQDVSHYYKARCTQISTPAYNGPSARITVTFECLDYRLYSVLNDQPVNGVLESNLSNFTFAGKHCLNDMSCMFIKDKIDALAVARVNKYIIPGVSGTVRYDETYIEYDEKSVSGYLYFVKGTNHDNLMSQTETDTKMHEVAAWLGNAGRDYIVFDSDTTRRYSAEVDKAQVMDIGETSEWMNGCIRLEMTLQPYSETIVESSQTKTIPLTSGGTIWDGDYFVGALPNGMGYMTPVKMNIVNNGPNDIRDFRIYSRTYSSDLLIPSSTSDQICRLYDGNDIIMFVDNNPTYAVSCELDSLNNEIMYISKNRSTDVEYKTMHREWLNSGMLPRFYYYPDEQRGASSDYGKFRFWADVETSVTVTVTARARWL